MSDKNKIERFIKELNLSPEKLEQLKKNMAIPVKIIGIGQTGVGKTELLKSIFRINKANIKASEESYKRIIDRLETGAVKSVTKDFYSFIIESDEGLMVQFTDGPGLGETRELEEKYLQMWINEIPKHDMLYWVLDGSSRDIGHIQENMKMILDKTGYRNKLVVVLNKIDQILLPQEMELNGIIGWDTNYNQPTNTLLKYINLRTEDIIEKLTNYVAINREQIVVCSARKRWNHGKVLDKILEYLPENIRIKASLNREVKDPSELMSPEAKKKLV
jgi:predicted GTPase